MGVCVDIFGVILLVWGMNKLVFSHTIERPTILIRGGYSDPFNLNPCENHACYPPFGNIVIGREKNLWASSTCGLSGEERFCTRSRFSDIKKCFHCDSRPFSKYPLLNHGVEQINKRYDSPRWPWWQSENGVEDVTIQFDLKNEFHVSHIILSFKSYPPKAMYIEKSKDFGKTWTVARYFAQNCTESFPGIPVGPIRHTDVICSSKWSSPVSEGNVIYRILSPKLKITNPYSQELQTLLTWTNIRFRFVKLHTMDEDEPSGKNKENYYYAIYNLVVRGSCICNGHASRCIPTDSNNAKGMVHSKCDCAHNTRGNQCEFCDSAYDLPWQPAIKDDTKMCKNIY